MCPTCLVNPPDPVNGKYCSRACAPYAHLLHSARTCVSYGSVRLKNGNPIRLEILRECVAKGMTATEAARSTKIAYRTIAKYREAFGLEFRDGRYGQNLPRWQEFRARKAST